MAYMDPRVFFQIVMPLLEVDSAVIIGISTPVADQYNFFDQLIRLKYPNTDDPVFASCQVDLVCSACKIKKRIDSCTHKLWALPSWKGQSKFHLAKLIYDHVGLSETRHRESLGLAMGNENAVFDPDHVQRLDRKAPLRNLHPSFTPGVIFMGIDPNASSNTMNNSHMAIVSLAKLGTFTSVVGLESYPTNWTTSVVLVRSHIEMLRRDPFLSTATIVAIIERNTGNEAGHLTDAIELYTNVLVFYEHAPPPDVNRRTSASIRARATPGIWTSVQTKPLYASAIQRLLSEKKLRFRDPLVTANPYDDSQRPFEINRKALLQQMSRSKWITNARTTDMPIPRTSWSAKTDVQGNLANAKDDLVVALGMTAHWMNRIMQRNYPTIDYSMLKL